MKRARRTSLPRSATPEALDQVFEKDLYEVRLGARIAFRPYLLFVDEDGEYRIGRVLFQVREGTKERICGRPVILAVGPDHAPIYANISRLKGGHYLDLGADEIFLGQAVPFREQPEHRLLYRFLILTEKRQAAEEDGEFLSFYRFRKFLLVLMLPGKMGEQVVDRKDGVILRPHPAPV